MDTWPTDKWEEYPHPGNAGNKKKTIAKTEKIPVKKRYLFDGKLAVYKAYLKQEKWQKPMQMARFVNNWEDLVFNVKAIRPAEQRCTVKEFQGHADRPDSEALFQQTMARLRR